MRNVHRLYRRMARYFKEKTNLVPLRRLKLESDIKKNNKHRLETVLTKSNA